MAQQIVDALQGRTASCRRAAGGSTLIPAGDRQSGGGTRRDAGRHGPFQGTGGRPGTGGQEEEDEAASGSRTAKDEGRIFLNDRVMDDPQPILFDPQHDASALNDTTRTTARAVAVQARPVRRAGPTAATAAASGPGSRSAPRTPVNAIPVPQAGYIILSGTNAEDV